MSVKQIAISAESSGSSTEVENLKSKVNSIINGSSERSERIVEALNFSQAGFDDATTELKSFILKMEEVSKPKGIFSNVAIRAKNLPGVGRYIEGYVQSAREDHLDSKSIKEIVETVFEGMTGKTEEVRGIIKNMILLKDEVENELNETLLLEEEVVLILSQTKENSVDHFEITDILNKIKKRKLSAGFDMNKLIGIAQVGKMVVAQIRDTLPESKGELLKQLSMDVGLTQIKVLVNNMNELNEVNNRLANASETKIVDTIKELFDLTRHDEKAIAILESRYSKRQASSVMIRDEMAKTVESTYNVQKKMQQIESSAPASLTIDGVFSFDEEVTGSKEIYKNDNK